MTDNLAERVLAAIGGAERMALDFRHGCDGDAGPWVTGEIAGHLLDYVVYRPSPDWCGHIVHACSTELAGRDGVQLARHIARQADPQAVLHRCAADRHTVLRHIPDEPITEDADGMLVTMCGYCGRRWPCPDLLDRAAANDVPVDGPTTTEER